MVIRNIDDKDIDSILELNEKSVSVLSPMNMNKLLRLIKISAVSIVIESQNKIAGFLLAFIDNVEYESINYKWFNDNYNKFLYIDRVVVSDEFRGMGVASKLYKYVLSWAIENSLESIFAEIDIKPPNEPSLSFHDKFGFKQIRLLKHNQDKIVALQELKLV